MKIKSKLSGYKKILLILSSIVVFVTTYFLILPAITLDKNQWLSGLYFEQKFITTPATLLYENENYSIEASFDGSAKFPKGIQLFVEEIKPSTQSYSAYKQTIDSLFKTESGERTHTSFVQLFDISFKLNDAEYQPKSPVKIRINYHNRNPEEVHRESYKLIHFKDINNVEMMESEMTSKQQVKDIATNANSFSVYAVARSANNDTVVIGGKTYYIVTYNYQDSAGNNKTSVNLVEALPNATLGALPQDPFVAGKRFLKWVDASGNVVGPSTPVRGSMQVTAIFETIEEYEVKVNYIYFNNAKRQDVVFDTEVYKLAEFDLPYKIKTPASSVIKTSDDSTLTRDAIYYPESTEINFQNQGELDAKDRADGAADRKITITHRYGPTNARFFYVYKLKNLNDNNYSDVKRVEGRGMVGSTVTAPIEIIPYATFERTDATEIFYEEGQEIPVYYRRGNVNLTFESNGGSYVNRITDTDGNDVLLPNTPPTKTGYTFDGWYEDAALTKKVTSNNVVLDKDKTLYAKWKVANTKYTILYYRYEYDENDYIGNTTHEQNQAVQPKERFIGSAEGSANTGDTIQASTAPDFTGVDDATGLAYTFGYQKYAAKNNTSVVVQPDGSSVIKVYYEPKTYTYEFLTRRNNAVITHLGKNEGNSYSFTAKTGQYIAQNWPVNWVGTNRTITSGDPTLTFLRWVYAGSTQGSITMQQFVSTEHIQKADASGKITYQAMWASSNNIMYLKASNGRVTEAERYGTARVNYYFEKEGQPGVYERNPLQSEDITFEKIQNITAKGFTGYDALNDGEIRALSSDYPRTRQANAPAQNGTHVVNRTAYPTYPNPPLTPQRDIHNGKTYDRIFEFYYKFKRYEIQYKYNGEVAAPTKTNLINGTNINTPTYNFVPTRPAGVDADYTWGGWHSDAALLNPAFNGSNPELIDGNKVLYAKWIPPKFNVNFNLNGGTATTPIATQRLDKYQKATVPTAPTKKFHTFEGWYTAPTGGTTFDFETPITKDTTLYARWKLKPIEYTVKYLDAETGQPILAERHVQGPDLTLGQVLGQADGIEAVAIPGYRPQELHKTITLTDNFDNNVAIFYYDKRNNNLMYTVDYVLQSDPTKKVATSKVETAGATVIKVRELAKAVDKAVMQASGITGDALLKDYYPVNQSEELVISSNQAHNKIVFEYVDRDTAIIEINYLDMDGNPIPGHPKRTEALNTPNILQTVAYKKDINGFTYNKVVDGSRVENKDVYVFNQGSKLVLNYYYQKNLKIKPRSDTKVYNGTALALVDGNSNDAIISTDTPLARGHIINQISFNNKTITNVGTVNPTVTRVKIVDGSNRDKTSYYHITFEPGTLTVTPKPVTVTVTGEQKNVVYNGQNHQIGYTITSNDANYYSDTNRGNITIGAITNVSEKNAGTYELLLSNKFTNSNNNYSVTFNVTNGRLVISKKDATITLKPVTKNYNGQAQSIDGNSNGLAVYDGFVNSEQNTITITPSGTRTAPGKTEIDFAWNSANKALLDRNYNITKVVGTLEILPVINLQKTTEQWVVLDGSTFELYQQVNDTWTIKGSPLSVTQNGVNLPALQKGKYRLKEVTAPNGYMTLPQFVYFDIVEMDNGDYVVQFTTGENGVATNWSNLVEGANDYSSRIQVKNYQGRELPETGGSGTSMIYVVGGMLLLLTTIGYKLNKK